MKLEQQVTSLELSKKLKELGVKQESLFYHVSMKFKGADLISGTEKCNPYLRYGHGGWVPDVCISAFTVAELDDFIIKGTYGDYAVVGNEEIFMGYKTKSYMKTKDLKLKEIGLKLSIIQSSSIMDENPANARAKMLIYLLENDLIKQ